MKDFVKIIVIVFCCKSQPAFGTLPKSCHHLISGYLQKTSIFSHTNWKTVSGPSLMKHIVNAHFQARTLMSFGVALWDLEILHYRGISPKWVINQIYKKLKQNDKDITSEIIKHGINIMEFTPYNYKEVLVRNLMLIERMWPHEIVSWKKVEEHFPNYTKVELNLKIHTNDGSFYKTHEFDINHSKAYLKWHNFNRQSI